MSKELKVAIIGLDTSHSIEFPRRMQAPDCPPENKVEGLRAVTCLPFKTPFTNDEVLATRQKQLEEWGVKIVDTFDEAVADCDAIMLEINDPAYHLEYFQKCVGLDKPIFLDKPMADNYENGKKIYDLAKEHGLNVLSASALRYSSNLIQACEEVSEVKQAYIYGPLGIPAVGSGVVWYGVHCFEMLQRAMGRGAVSVDVRRDEAGAVAIVEYPDNRRGIVELTVGNYNYGGTLKGAEKIAAFKVDNSKFYTEELRDILSFFQTGKSETELVDTLEVMDLLDCAAKSYETGQPVKLHTAK
jgi:predicted dehydrogenase